MSPAQLPLARRGTSLETLTRATAAAAFAAWEFITGPLLKEPRLVGAPRVESCPTRVVRLRRSMPAYTASFHAIDKGNRLMLTQF